MKSMTEGKPVKLILSFAFPLLLGNLFQQTYNMVDAAIVGQYLGTKALASVGASSSVQFLILGFCIGVCCGFGIMIAQKFGAEHYRQMRLYIYNAAILTILVALILTVGCSLLTGKILHMLSTPDDIFEGAYQYLLIIFLGIPFTLLYNLLASILRAVGDSKTPFIFLAVSTVLNIVLDLFCIIVLQLGCAGAGLATIMAQGISGLLCLFYIIKKLPQLRPTQDERKWNLRAVENLTVSGVPMGLQFSITAIGSMVMQSANNGLGTVYVSAFTAGMRLKQLMLCPFDALATGVSTFASQNLGARKVKRIYTGIQQGIMMSVIYGIFAGVILIFFGRTMSMLFISKEATEILDAAGRYLACLGFFFWSLGILNVCRMSIQGLGYAGRSMISGVLEMIARIVVSVFFVPIFGFGAICWADQTAWIAACLFVVPMVLICAKTCCNTQKI